METVPIAEDDPILRKRLVTLRGRYSDRLRVIPAGDGREAVAVLQRESAAPSDPTASASMIWPTSNAG